MKFSPTLLFLLIGTPLSFGAEVLESLKTRAGREYFKVEVLTNDDVGIRIRHEAGTARIPYEDLPDAAQSKYHAERKKAAVAKIEATKADLERIRQEEEKNKQALLEEKTKKPKKARFESKDPEPTPSEIQPVEGDKEIEKLDTYIAGMKTRADEAVFEASKLRRLAETERSRTRFVIKKNGDGGAVSKVVPDKSGWAKATRYEEEAAVLERQAENARAMIREAGAKRRDLIEDQGSASRASEE